MVAYWVDANDVQAMSKSGSQRFVLDAVAIANFCAKVKSNLSVLDMLAKLSERHASIERK